MLKGKLKLKWKLFTIICHFHSMHLTGEGSFIFFIPNDTMAKFSKVFLFSLLLKYSIFFLIWSIYQTNKMRKEKFVFSFKWFLFSYVHRINVDGSPKKYAWKDEKDCFHSLSSFPSSSLSLSLAVERETRRDPK